MCERREDHKSDLCIKEAVFVGDRKLRIETGRQEVNLRNGISLVIIGCSLPFDVLLMNVCFHISVY